MLGCRGPNSTYTLTKKATQPKRTPLHPKKKLELTFPESRQPSRPAQLTYIHSRSLARSLYSRSCSARAACRGRAPLVLAEGGGRRAPTWRQQRTCSPQSRPRPRPRPRHHCCAPAPAPCWPAARPAAPGRPCRACTLPAAGTPRGPAGAAGGAAGDGAPHTQGTSSSGRGQCLKARLSAAQHSIAPAEHAPATLATLPSPGPTPPARPAQPTCLWSGSVLRTR